MPVSFGKWAPVRCQVLGIQQEHKPVPSLTTFTEGEDANDKHMSGDNRYYRETFNQGRLL